MSASSTGTEAILSVHGVRIAIGARLLAERVDCDVRQGEMWCLLGPNGSGKSTLLHTLAGVRQAQAGSIRFGGRPWPQWHARQAALKRGLLQQQQSHAFSASVIETVLIGRHPHIGRYGWESEHDRQCALRAIHCMDLGALATRDVLHLSGGERQRVALAMLLAQDPTLFLLDEPTAHIDLAHQVSLFRHLVSLVREHGRAVVFATHDYNLAARFATHALLLSGDGRAAAGPVAQMLHAERLSSLFGFPLAAASSAGASVFAPQW